MTTFGTGTFGSGTFGNPSPGTYEPTGINDAVNLDAPVAAFIGDPIGPDGDITLTVAIDDPAIAVTPDGIGDAIAHDAPTATETDEAQAGDGPAATISHDNPAAEYLITAVPDGIGNPTALDAPTLDLVLLIQPDGSVSDAITLDAPVADARFPADVTVGIAVGVTGDDPTAGMLIIAAPDGLNDTMAGDPPANTFTAAAAVGDGPAVAIANDGPAITLAAAVSLAGGLTVKPVPGGAISVRYPDAVITASPHYDPIVPIDTTVPAAATHSLGIGPWNTNIAWSGLGTTSAVYGASVPVLPLPNATSKSFTLRLNAGDEARADFILSREDAFIITERSTDLWWRRRDPKRSLVEPIGRFNADNVDTSMDEDGQIRVSATFVDYRSLLEDRIILTVANTPTAGLSSWPRGTVVTDILRFVIPTNQKVDLTEITAGTETFVGTITEPIELPPGTTVGEAMANLATISTSPWEWWVELPINSGDRPKLRLAPNGRGATRGIYLIDTGTGQSPIRSWSIQAAGSKYANAIYFQASQGGVVETLPADVETYGEHDAMETDTSIKSTATTPNLPLVTAAATKKLNELANQQITWTLNLREGFWEGRTHIDVGDWVTVQINLGGELITGAHRVSEISGEVDAGGAENIALTLGPPRPARDPRSRYSSTARLVRTLKNYTRQDNTP